MSTGSINTVVLSASPSGSVTLTVKRYTPVSGVLGSATTLGTVTLSSSQHAIFTGLNWAVTAGDLLSMEISGISIELLHVILST